MQFQDFNSSAAPREIEEPQITPAAASQAEPPPVPDDRAAVEIALLKAQIEHLELVVETARSLLTSNQERLLRRLHDVPREIATLSARLDRIDNPGQPAATERFRAERLRRVA